MSQVCIRGVGCYLPDARLTNQALATRLGVTDDYIVKPYAPDELLTRVRNLVRRSRPPTRTVSPKLTKREQEVLRLLTEGFRPDEIAERLFISPKTVEANLARVYRKLGIRTRAELGRHIGTDGDQ